MSTLMCWMTHRTDSELLPEFDRIEVPDGWRKEVLYDADACDRPDRESASFSLNELRSRGYRVDGRHFGWQQWPLVDRILETGADAGWLVEWDVRFTEDWRRFFAGHSADVVAGRIRQRCDDPEWWWWRSLESTQPVALIAAYCPVMRISRRCAEALRHYHDAGWQGHTEVFVPTVARHAGLTVADFGPWYSEDTYRWRPAHESTPRKDTLYHPVKL